MNKRNFIKIFLSFLISINILHLPHIKNKFIIKYKKSNDDYYWILNKEDK
jgi:hypothetical protein